MSDISEIGRKLGALEIMFTSPLWPKRSDLSETGQALFDLIVNEGKAYALCVVDEDFLAALVMLSKWSKALNCFIDATMISSDKPAEMLVAVFLHYADACRIDFREVQKA